MATADLYLDNTQNPSITLDYIKKVIENDPKLKNNINVQIFTKTSSVLYVDDNTFGVPLNAYNDKFTICEDIKTILSKKMLKQYNLVVLPASMKLSS